MFWREAQQAVDGLHRSGRLDLDLDLAGLHLLDDEPGAPLLEVRGLEKHFPIRGGLFRRIEDSFDIGERFDRATKNGGGGATRLGGTNRGLGGRDVPARQVPLHPGHQTAHQHFHGVLAGRQVAHVAEVLRVQHPLGQRARGGQAVGEEAGVEGATAIFGMSA